MKYSLSDEHYTPPWVTDPLGPFDLDPCAGPMSNIAGTNYRLPEQNGLALDWFGFVWLNPPFSQKGKWFQKMKGHGHGILLLTDRTSAPWFGTFANHCGHLFLMGQRINFINSTSTNPMGSVLFPFGPLALERLRTSGLPGLLLKVEQFTPRKVEGPGLFDNLQV